MRASIHANILEMYMLYFNSYECSKLTVHRLYTSVYIVNLTQILKLWWWKILLNSKHFHSYFQVCSSPFTWTPTVPLYQLGTCGTELQVLVVHTPLFSLLHSMANSVKAEARVTVHPHSGSRVLGSEKPLYQLRIIDITLNSFYY